MLVAITTPFRADLSVDYDRLQEHVRWLAAEGCHGVAPCASMGEYRALSDDERAAVVRATVQAAPSDCAVLPGVGGYGSRQARHWAEQAAEAGAHGVLARPPAGPAAGPADVVAHYREVAAVGLPVVAHNEPYDTRLDLTPDLLARIAEIDGIAAVKEVTGDVRRLHRLRDLCPHVDVLVGVDDVALELVLCGAAGWVACLPNALPRQAVHLYELCVARDLDRALPLYAELHPILGWASRPESVQAVKLAMECAGRFGGRCRPPRGPLPVSAADRVRRDVLRALSATVEPASEARPG